jgi:DNA-binding NarL/FixJ family response regulator
MTEASGRRGGGCPGWTTGGARIHTVAADEVVFGSGVAGRALAYFSAATPSARAARPFPELTDREIEVLRLVADGAGNSTIARSLHLSDKTVRNYIASILTKMQADDRPKPPFARYGRALAAPIPDRAER